MKTLVASLVVLCATFAAGQSAPVLMADSIPMLHPSRASAPVEIAVNRVNVGVFPSLNPPAMGAFQVSGGAHSVALSWNAGTCPTGQTCGAVTGWNVYRATGGGSMAKIASTPATQLNYTDSSAAFQIEGTTYSYAATAFNMGGTGGTMQESAKSNTVTATVPVSAPGVPPTMNPPVVQ